MLHGHCLGAPPLVVAVCEVIAVRSGGSRSAKLSMLPSGRLCGLVTRTLLQLPATARKRTVQRLATQQAEREWLRDIKHNPRKLWTQYRGQTASGCMRSMESLAAHWGSLYQAEEGTSLRDLFTSVSDCV